MKYGKNKMADNDEPPDEEIDYNSQIITLSLDIFTTIPSNVNSKPPKKAN